jgi:hypothetical protein
LNKAFANGRRVAKCPCTICRNYSFLTHDKVQIHLCQEEFMPNYLVWRDHGEAEELPDGATMTPGDPLTPHEDLSQVHSSYFNYS